MGTTAVQTLRDDDQPCEDELDALIDRVAGLLDGLEHPELLRLAPSAPEAVMCLLGLSSELRPGPWYLLVPWLRREMAQDEGITVGSC